MSRLKATIGSTGVRSDRQKPVVAPPLHLGLRSNPRITHTKTWPTVLSAIDNIENHYYQQIDASFSANIQEASQV